MTKVDWRSLAATLNTLSEDEIKKVLDFEMDNQRRPSIVRRLHQRFAMLRSARERAELMARLAA
jgi:hypothetical protein|tara:strand:- start:86 stop:277 length:192 start_codon:yes stop_codon:yes gene_type:complete